MFAPVAGTVHRTVPLLWVRAKLEPTPCCDARHLRRRRRGFLIYRSLPLARLPLSATGGGRLAPLREPGGLFEACCAIQRKRKTTRLGGLSFSGKLHRKRYRLVYCFMLMLISPVEVVISHFSPPAVLGTFTLPVSV